MKNKNQPPQISILMPVYNALPYLKVCVDSIISQSFTDWELIAVDDFSTDESISILLAYAECDSRIKVRQNTTKGIIHALRTAYRYSSGSYITRMDADDIMPLKKLDSLYQLSYKNKDACVTAKVKYFSDDTVNEGYLKYAAWLNGMIDNHDHYEHIYKECVVPSPCWMMHKETLEKIQAFYPSRYPEDYDLVFRLYKYEVPIIGIDSILHLWRDHPSRASRNDPNYENQKFYTLKYHYFIDIDYDPRKKLIIWGAGKNGKHLVSILVERPKPFIWITGNPNKIGHEIYGHTLEDEKRYSDITDAQIIIAIQQQGFLKDNEEAINRLRKHNNVYIF